MSIRDHLEELIAAAERGLLAQTGDEAACVLHRDGRVTGGMKCHEGRLVALTRARRMLDAAAPVPALETAAAEGQAESDRRVAAQDPSPPWVAYATGGLEAAHEAPALVRDLG